MGLGQPAASDGFVPAEVYQQLSEEYDLFLAWLSGDPQSYVRVLELGVRKENLAPADRRRLLERGMQETPALCAAFETTLLVANAGMHGPVRGDVDSLPQDIQAELARWQVDIRFQLLRISGAQEAAASSGLRH